MNHPELLKAEPKPAICANCAHVKRLDIVGKYECHFGPPTPFLIPQGPQHLQTISIWPPVDGRGHCGQHRPEGGS